MKNAGAKGCLQLHLLARKGSDREEIRRRGARGGGPKEGGCRTLCPRGFRGSSLFWSSPSQPSADATNTTKKKIEAEGLCPSENPSALSGTSPFRGGRMRAQPQVRWETKSPPRPAKDHPHKALRTAAPPPHPQRHPPPLRGGAETPRVRTSEALVGELKDGGGIKKSLTNIDYYAIIFS